MRAKPQPAREGTHSRERAEATTRANSLMNDALALATPTAITVGVGQGARGGSPARSIRSSSPIASR